MQFDFATASRILFGAGSIKQLKAPGRALMVTGSTSRWTLQGAPLFRVPKEPTVDLVREGTAFAKAESCDCVIACGGGSVIDAGKAIAALLGNDGDPLDYLEVVGRGQPLSKPSVPFIAVPTTAGTGSEVTRNAVLASPKHKVKASLRGPHMLPTVAVVDPELTLPLPPAVTAATGMDALTQCIEPFVSCRANAMTDLYCREGIERAMRSLRRAVAHGDDLHARTDMCMASLMGGLALANAGLGAVHGFAAPIGGMFDAPHGAVCAALLAPVIEMNAHALEKRAPDSESLRRIHALPDVSTLADDLGIPKLHAYGISSADVPEIVEKAAAASSMKANPINLTREELEEILFSAL